MLAENYHFVPVFSDDDLNVGATGVGDSINMSGFHSACFLVNCQTLGGANCTLALWSGATDAALTSVLTFNYAWMTAIHAGVDADVLTAWTSAAVVEMTHATYDNFLLVIEIEAAAMDTANHENWLTLVRTDPAGGSGNISCVAVLTPRYGAGQHVSALV